MNRILFVDDDVPTLQEFRHILQVRCPQWEMAFVESGAQALELLAQGSWDAIVSDLIMPNMDGVELLTRTMASHPGTVRIMLTGQADWKTSLQVMKVAHQYLAKPCDYNALVDMLTRSLLLRDRLAEPRVKRLVAQLPALPSLPRIYLELLEKLRAEDPSSEQIGKLISRDPSICAKLLQLVNSAFFGLPQTVTNPADAVLFLGVETVKALVLSLQIFALFERVPVREFSYEGLWSHSWFTGQLARRIALAQDHESNIPDYAFAAGLLHDVGKLVLVTGLPNRYRDALHLQLEKKCPLWQAEQKIFSSTHAEVGAYLLSLWGLPNAMVEAVAFHHEPQHNAGRFFGTATAVHVANALIHELPGQSTSMNSQLDLAYLTELGLQGRLEAWREQLARIHLPPKAKLG